MYEQLLQEHIHNIKRFGLSPQPPATQQELQAVREESKTELGFDPPPEYDRLLKMTNGLESNGLSLYGSARVPLVDYKDRFVQGLVYANLNWRDHEPNKRYVFFGDGGLSMYGYDLEDRKYQLVDRTNGDVLEEFDSFEAMIYRALEENHP
jgi:hypothetical protein